MQNSAIPLTKEDTPIARAILEITASVSGVAPPREEEEEFQLFLLLIKAPHRRESHTLAPLSTTFWSKTASKPASGLQKPVEKRPLRYHCVYKGMRPFPLEACPGGVCDPNLSTFSLCAFRGHLRRSRPGFALGEFGLFGVHAVAIRMAPTTRCASMLRSCRRFSPTM